MLHPLSVFPSLLSYPFLAIFILRLAVAWGVYRVGMMRWKKSYKNLAIVEFVVGLFVLLGFYTQPAMIAVIILFILEKWLDTKAMTLDQNEKIISVLICIIAFSLLFLGPGAYSLDLPL